MKVGIIRGVNLNPWEMQSFVKLKKFGITPVGICGKDNNFKTDTIDMEIRKLTSGRGLYGGRNFYFLSRLIDYYFSADGYLFNFENSVKDLDLLHPAEIYNFYTYQAIKINKPTVITVSENIPFHWEYFSLRKLIGKRLIYEKIKQKVKERSKNLHFVTATELSKKILEMEGIDNKRITVIYPGIDLSRFKPQNKNTSLISKLNIPESAMVILFVGRLNWEKGIYFLIYAFFRLLKEWPGTFLVIVGRSPFKNLILELVNKLKIAKNIIFLGNIDYQEMPKVYSIADIFCLPSIPIEYWQEQFGYVLVEAMACGLPVVSTLTGGIPEVVNNGFSGILVPPADIESLKLALSELISNKKKRKAMAENARRWAVEKFDADIFAEKMANVYNSLV